MRNEKFIQKAESLKAELLYETVRAKYITEIYKDGTEYKEQRIGNADNLPSVPLKKGDKICLDFGQHCVGYVSFLAGSVGNPPDNPAHIKVKFGETRMEIAESFEKYDGNISSSWLQEEYMFIDILPSEVKMPRRYAFRYMEIEVLDTSHQYQLVLDQVICTTVSSADRKRVPLLKCTDQELKIIDNVAINTLEGCMQEVFEDGPKRDRRLWMGDLRLQALTNYVTFQNNDLVKRCLYLFAGVPLENGKTGGCLYIKPKVIVDKAIHLFDYSLFFVSCLYDYYKHTRDEDTLKDLWETCWRQISLAFEDLDEKDMVKDHPEDWWWCFIDWNPKLNKQAAAQAILLFSIKQAEELAEILGRTQEKELLKEKAKKVKNAALEYLWDEKAGFFISGEDRQISWASQIWFAISGVFSQEKTRDLLVNLENKNPSIGLTTPYMHHCYVEALVKAGMLDKAKEHIKKYWGGMVNAGADCFWEVYDMDQPNLSAYGDCIINSYCHAWSCTPAYFIRKYFAEDDMEFQIKEGKNKTLESIVNINDTTGMNWVAEGKKWGKLYTPEDIQGTVQREFTIDGKLVERYTFINNRDRDYLPKKGEIGIAVPFPDNYTSAEICMEKRCHAHIWCGKSQTYIAGMRMGGFGPNLGLTLTEGRIECYSITRDTKEISNDRGTIILNPEIKSMKPGEKTVLEWELFWFQEEADFENKIIHQEKQLWIQLERGIYFSGEEIRFRIIADKENWKSKELLVRLDDRNISLEKEENQNCIIYSVSVKDNTLGEKKFQIQSGDYKTMATVLVQPEIQSLAEKRCSFIASRQQYIKKGSFLDGAFLIYDNEDSCLIYEKEYDHNGGRERVGMGVLLACWLQNNKDENVEAALERFTEYVYRELYDEDTGIVYNDIRRDNTWNRLYNYPWLAVFFMERYKLFKDQKDILNMYKILKSYYFQDGFYFYAIGIPMYESVQLLQKAGFKEEAAQLLNCYKTHGEMILKNGLHYPAHEVKYEQSIVAPAVAYLLQLYELTGDNVYLKEGKKQMEVLQLFNGHQPDFHLYENAVRHWDGFWFGKRKNYGDTFPHYWSALSGMAFLEYGKITGEKDFYNMGENSLRGVLSMFHSDGSASCAYVYPHKVNDVQCGYYDPWANDQDWGLYFYLKEGMSYDRNKENV